MEHRVTRLLLQMLHWCDTNDSPSSMSRVQLRRDLSWMVNKPDGMLAVQIVADLTPAWLLRRPQPVTSVPPPETWASTRGLTEGSRLFLVTPGSAEQNTPQTLTSARFGRGLVGHSVLDHLVGHRTDEQHPERDWCNL